MRTLKITSGVLCFLFVCLYSLSIAQDDAPPPPPPSNYGPAARDRAYSQANQEAAILPSGYVSINFGFALPQGGFASSTNNTYGGYAIPGDVFHLSLAFPVNHSNFGLAFMFASYSNEYDLGTYANNNLAYAVYPSQNFYDETAMMGGLFVTFPVGILSFDGRLMAGALLNSLPEQDYTYNDAQGNTFENDLMTSRSTSLALDAGVGVRCLIVRFWGSNLCAMVNVDYLYSNVPYTTQQNIYETPANGPNSGVTEQLIPNPILSGHIPVELLNITFGLGYQI